LQAKCHCCNAGAGSRPNKVVGPAPPKGFCRLLNMQVRRAGRRRSHPFPANHPFFLHRFVDPAFRPLCSGYISFVCLLHKKSNVGGHKRSLILVLLVSSLDPFSVVSFHWTRQMSGSRSKSSGNHSMWHRWSLLQSRYVMVSKKYVVS